MNSPSCGVCNAPVPEGSLVCTGCGAPRSPARSPEDERLIVHQWRQALLRALDQEAPDQQGKPFAVLDRFLQTALLPSVPELVIEEALWCQQQFTPDGLMNPRLKARFETLLTRLELLALEQPTLLRRLELFRQELARQHARERSFNWSMTLWLLAALGLVLGAGGLLVRACS